MERTMVKNKHSVRVHQDLWDAVKAKANAEYTTVSAIIVQALKAYVKE